MRTWFVFCILIELLAHRGFAASEFLSCQGVDVSASYSFEEVVGFVIGLKAEFENRHRIAQSEIERSMACLKDEKADASCAARNSYYLETVAAEWKVYRRSLALSRWRNAAGPYAGGPKDQFNFDLADPSYAWIGQVKPEALIGQEEKEVEEEINKISTRIYKSLILEAAGKDPSAIQVDQIKEAEGRLQVMDWAALRSSSYYWPQRAVQKIQSEVFYLNRKRLIRQISKIHILAFMTQAQVNKASMIEALSRMSQALDHERVRVVKLWARLPSAEALRADQALIISLVPRMSELMDYRLIVEAALSKNPRFCPVAESLSSNIGNLQLLETGMLFAGGVGAAVMAPAGWLFACVMAGLGIFQGYTIYDAYHKYYTDAESALSSPQMGSDGKSVEQVIFSAENFKGEVYLAPSILVGMPLLRVSRYLKIFKEWKWIRK
ncbi:MAG: hypothetical protein C5B49_12270 [Bdellovibrio sp.]|nr:MAG: hypothetical protein C5B49_12270 [Bdellovibrio sp.]